MSDPDAADLRLLEDVQYRFALADTDEKLQTLLNIYLVPTLLKLNTTSQPVIRKVAAICSHLSKRVKTANVSLPTSALLTQFHNQSLGPYVKNFNLIYLDVALSREKDISQFGPQLLDGISTISQSGMRGYFPVMMRALVRWNFDLQTPGLSEQLGLSKEDSKCLASMFENLLLYDGTMGSQPPPPTYISKDGFPNLNALNAAKLAAAKLTRAALGEDGALTLFIGARDANTEVADFCNDAIKRLGINYEDPTVVRGLYSLYFSEPRLNIQIGIIEALGRSVLAANTMPEMLQLLQRGFERISHPKLQRAHIGFVQWVMRTATDSVVLPITQPLLTNVISALEQLGTPTDLRQFFYISIGLIVHRNPSLVRQDPQILKILFQAAIQEHPSIKISITESLSLVFPAVQNPSPELGAILMSLIHEITVAAPAVAIKFASAFPFSTLSARAVALQVLGQGGLTSDLRQNAYFALDPYYFKLGTQITRNPLPPNFYTFPTFEEAVSSLGTLDNLSVVDTIRFLRMIWLHEALGQTFRFDDENWRDRLDVLVEADDVTRGRIKSFLESWSINRNAPLEKYFEYLRQVLRSGNEDQVLLSAKSILELVSLGGKELSVSLIPDMNAIRELVFSRNELLRIQSAELLGIVCGEIPGSVESMIVGLLRFSEGSVEKQHGAVIAVGSIIARISVQGKLGTISEEVLNRFTSNVSGLIESPNTNTLLLEAALQSVSSLCIFGAGTLLQKSQRAAIIARLQSLSKSTRHGNLQDRAVLTLGYISFALTIPEDESMFDKILEALYAIYEQKQVELSFSAGEALSCLAGRWHSKAMTKFRDTQIVINQEPLTGLLDKVLNTLLENVRSPNHALRKAASIWLLSILQFCDNMVSVKQNLDRMHAAFVSLLTDRDDFVQEIASKGMALVYLRGDKKMKEDLVWNLIGSVTSEVRPSTNITGTISPDTQILDLTTADAGEVSTYKEICNLASDTGNPELIYRFLALSSHSALLQSRKGAAIGIGGILNEFNMENFLTQNPNYAKRLLPKLYRLCRDPNPGVARAMQDIWDAAFGKGPNPLVMSMFHEIIKELLNGMGDKLWRTRQASAKAMGDLCSGVELNILEPYLEEIWKMAFRVADDLKETVRNAGIQLSQQLTTTLIRNVTEGKSGQKIVSTMIPFLLGNSGLNSSAQGVQLFALRSIVKLCEEAGILLKPMVPEIVDQLLDVLTSLEPQQVNYIGFHVEENDSLALDESRFHAVRTSPVMSAIEKCIDLVDEETVQALARILLTKTKRAAGLPTKAGCAKLIVSLVMRKASLFQPYADQALKAVTSCLNDRNETVRKTFAGTAGYLARLATRAALVEYIQEQVVNYFSDDEKQRVMSGIAIEGISRNASSVFTSAATSVLPFVFLAKHDPEESVREPFVETWSENTGGSGAVKLYIREIMNLVAQHLEAPQWRVKQVAGLALADACEAIGIDIREHLMVVQPLLLKGVGGRTWKGKEAVLKALVVVASNAKEYLSLKDIEEITNVMIREAKRKDQEYKRYATMELGNYLSVFSELNIFPEVQDIVEESLEELNNEDDDGDLQMKPIRLLLRGNLYNLVAVAFQPSIDPEGTAHAVWIIKFLTTKIPVATNWSVRIALCKCAQTFISRCAAVNPQLHISDEAIFSLWQALKNLVGDRGYESVRIAAAKTVIEYLTWIEVHPEWADITTKVKAELAPIIESETTSVLAEWRKRFP